MNALFSDTMTVYNYRRDEETETETWQCTEVRGVQWTHNKKEVTVTGGAATEKKVESVTIDFQRFYGNKSYIAPNEYRKLSVKESSSYWTLDAEPGQDVLVLGVSDKVISKSYRLKDLKQDFQYTGTVTAVSDNRNRPRLKQIKVVCG